MKIDLIYDSSREEDYVLAAQSYAEKNNFKIEKRLGSGNWGVAFLSNEGEVIKATSDPAEVFNAIQLKDKKMENVANIYDVDYSLENEIAVIRQDKVNPLSILQEKMLKTTQRKLLEADQSFESLDEFYLNESNINLTNKELILAREIFNGVNEIYDNNGVAEDLDITNIGTNDKGQFVIFDQKSINEDPQEYIKKLNALKNKKTIKRKP